MYHELYQMNVNCLRLFTVYGEFGRIDMAPFLFMDAICNEKPITIMGDGSAKRDFTLVQDVMNGFIAAIDKPLGYSVINIGSGTKIFIKDFIRIIEDITGKKARLKKLVANLKLTNYVHFYGWKTHNEIIQYLTLMNLMILSSIISKDGDEEGIPNAVKEAMAVELPVITTERVGSELVKDFLIQEKNYQQLALKIAFFIENQD